MNKFIRYIVIACTVNVLVAPAAFSQTELSKDEAREQAPNVCQTQAEQRYGEKSVKSMASKVKWNRDFNGASVKMKIKPKSNKPSKYVCILGLDKSVIFFKA